MYTEQKNRKRKLLAETAIYGLLSMIYGSLFFFGALYPQYGFASACMEEEEEGKEAEKDTKDGNQEKEDSRDENLENGDTKVQKIIYKSFLLERMKEWL